MQRLLLGGALALVAVVAISTAITVLAPYLAILAVVILAWKLSRDEFGQDEDPKE